VDVLKLGAHLSQLASSAPIGSSISSALGRRTSARPIATRRMSPPDRAEGRLSSKA
jgi:hypothetical protein